MEKGLSTLIHEGVITVRYTSALFTAAQMKRIAAEIHNNCFSIELSDSEGEMANAILELSSGIKEYGEALALLIDRTAGAVRAAAIAFYEADSKQGRTIGTIGNTED
jgi:hypothetical protein